MTLDFKRGGTFSMKWAAVDSVGARIDITAMTITSKLKRTGSTITLTVTKTDAANGEFTISATAVESALWLIGLYDGDIKIVGTNTDYSINFQVDVQRNISG